jgi:hypothetical protein
MMGWNVAGRWSGGSELVLAPCEGSMTCHDDVMMSAGGEAAPGRGKGEDDVNWADINLTGSKMKKIHIVNSVATNERWRFKAMMS